MESKRLNSDIIKVLKTDKISPEKKIDPKVELLMKYMLELPMQNHSPQINPK